MEETDRSWLALLEELPRRVILLLADSSAPVSGRRVADALGVSPTTASATLRRLHEHGLVRWQPAGRAKLWELDVTDPRVRELRDEGRRGANWRSTDPTGELEVQSAHGSTRPVATVVVLTALELEYAAVQEHLRDMRLERARHGTRFEVGQLEGEYLTWNVAIAEIGMGNAGAAAEVGSAIELFHPDLLLFVGVAGSVKPADLRRGDVVVADRVYNLHAGKISGTDPVAGYLSRPLSFPTSHRLLQLVRAVCRSSWPDVLQEPGIRAGEQGPPHNDMGMSPRAEVRAIVAGEVVLASDEAVLWRILGERLNDVAAIDMESAGLYETAHRHDNLPVLAVRGISDTVGDKTPPEDTQWQPRAAAHAAAFAVALLRQTAPADLRPSQAAPAPGLVSDAVNQVPGTERDSLAASRRVGGGVAARRRPSRTQLRAALDRLPPGIGGMHSWARRHDRIAADRAVLDLAMRTETPAGWLGRVRHRLPSWLRDSAGPARWALLATFAEAYDSPHTSWAYAQAAEQAVPGMVQAVLLCRAGLGAARHGHRDQAHQMLIQATTVEPAVTLLATTLRAAVDDDVAGLLRGAVTLAPALDLNLPTGDTLHRLASSITAATIGIDATDERDGVGLAEDELNVNELSTAIREELAEDAPELLGELQDTLAMYVGAALRVSGEPAAALQVFRALAANTHVSDTAAAGRGSQAGPRAAGPLLEEARILLDTLTRPSGIEPTSDVSATLQRAAELALVARDRRRDWNGPTGDALAVAGRARTLASDVPGALQLLLPPPRGTASPAEATHPEVIGVATMTALMSGDTELALHLARRMTDQVEADLITGLAYSAAPGCHDLAIEAFRRALAHADRTDQRFRALFGLSRLGHGDDAALAMLAEQNPEAADLVRAAQHIRAGRYDEALLLTRRYPRSADALELTVDALVSGGRPAEAVEILDRAGRRRADEDLLAQAAAIALQAGLLDDAHRLARAGIDSNDARRRRTSRQMLLDIAGRRGDWEEVVEQARRLLDNAPADATDDGYAQGEENQRVAYRWALVTALANQRRHAEALRALEQPAPLMPLTAQQALLYLQLLHSALTDPRVPRETVWPNVARSGAMSRQDDRKEGERVLLPSGALNVTGAIARAVTLARAFPDNEEVNAAALTLTLITPTPPQLPADTLAQLRGLQEDFFTRFPDTRYVQRLDVGEDLSELTAYLRTSLEPRAALLTDLFYRVWLGVYPASVLAEVTGRSYAENLIKIKRTTQCLVVTGADPQAEAAERRAALEAIGGPIVVDTSTLVLLEQVMDDPQRLLAYFSAVLVSSTLRDDALRARSALLLRSTDMLSWDPKRERPLLIEHDPGEVEGWAQAAMRLVDRFSDCTAVPDSFGGPAGGGGEPRQWHASITLAANRRIPLLADDAALRTVARAEDVPAFGILQLLRALADTDNLTIDDVGIAGELLRGEERLRALRALDLGIPATDLPSLAADEQFDPRGSVALLLAHPPAWQPASAGFAAYTTIVRALPDRTVGRVAGWCAAAISGLAWATVPAARPRAVAALLAWTTINAGGSPVLAKALDETSSLLAHVLPDANVLSHVVDVLVEVLESVLPASDVPAALLPLLGDLPEEAHTRALHYFLTRRRSDR
jgi:nucleoside phosphorylase/tetratricopeptide (TPR) repeat protein/DNA-binding transcriptional ArsR family regulator